MSNVVRAPEPIAASQAEASEASETSVDVVDLVVSGVWVLCRKQASGDVEAVRAFDDEARARAELELAASVSNDEFWVATVPLIAAAP